MSTLDDLNEFINVPQVGHVNNPFMTTQLKPTDELTSQQIFGLFNKPSRKWSLNYTEILERFEQPEISNEWLDRVANDLVLVSLPKLFWYTEYFTFNVRSVPFDFIDRFNHYEYLLKTDNVMCVPMLNINETVWQKFMSVVKCESYNLKDIALFYNIKSFISYQPKQTTQSFLKSLMLSENVLTYWKDSYKCHFSFTNAFAQRLFNRVITDRRTFDNIAANIPDLVKTMTTKEKNNLNRYDIAFTVNVGSNTIKLSVPPKWFESGKQTNIVTSLKYLTPELFNEWFNDFGGTPSTNPAYVRDMFMLIANMVTSRDHAHLIMNNYQFLTTHKDVLNKNLPLVKYLFSYGFLTLYLKELACNGMYDVHEGYLYDINTANALPYFPMNYEDVSNNPYYPIMINKQQITTGTLMTTPHIQTSDRLNGVCDLVTFKKRMNLFISGTNIDLISDILKTTDAAITGSIMTATLTKYNWAVFKTKLQTSITDTDAYKEYYKNVYGSSDVDMMIKADTYPEFIVKAEAIQSQLSHKIMTELIKQILNDQLISQTYDIDKLTHEIESIKPYLIQSFANSSLVFSFTPNYIKHVLLPQLRDNEQYITFLRELESKGKLILDINLELDEIELTSEKINDELNILYFLRNMVKKDLNGFKKMFETELTEYFAEITKQVIHTTTYTNATPRAKQYIDNFCNIGHYTTILVGIIPDGTNFKYETGYTKKCDNGGILRMNNSVKYTFSNLAKSEHMVNLVGDTLNEVFTSSIIDPENTSSMNYVMYTRGILKNILLRDFELFKTRKTDEHAFASMVVRFHVPSVRAYYDGENVYLTPSCVSSHLTMMSLNLHYFSGSKNITEIIFKNMYRGFGFCVNATEKATLTHSLYKTSRTYRYSFIRDVLTTGKYYNPSSLPFITADTIQTFWTSKLQNSVQVEYYMNNYERFKIFNDDGTVKVYDPRVLTEWLNLTN